MFFDIYTLPYLVINAGQESSFQFRILNSDGEAVKNATFKCDVIEYCNEGAPVLSFSGVVEYDSASDSSAIGLTFSSTSTLALEGKYIYQLAVTLSSGYVGEVRKGILYVRSNVSS